MHIQIHDISGQDLLVETCEEDLQVVRVTRDLEPGGRFHSITIVIEDLMADDTDEYTCTDESIDELIRQQDEEDPWPSAPQECEQLNEYVNRLREEIKDGEDLEALDHCSLPFVDWLARIYSPSRQGTSSDRPGTPNWLGNRRS